MKKLTAVAAFLLVLLPTQLPPWLDTAPPLGSEPLRGESRTIVRGTIARPDDARLGARRPA